MKKTIFTLSILSVMMFTGCSSDDDSIDNVVRRPLNVMIDDTRAAATTTSTLTSFKMYAVEPFTDYTLTKNNDGLWFSSPLSWPAEAKDDDNVTFYAVDGGTYNANGRYVTHNVNEDAFNQKDLLVAATNANYTASAGVLHLSFKHVCTAVNFYVSMTNTLKGKLGDKTLYVTEVKLTGVKNTGHYDLATDNWTNVSGNASYTLTTSHVIIGTETEAQELPCQYLFMIPQTLTDQVKIEFKYKVGENGEERSNSISLKDKLWKDNQKDNIIVKLGTSLININ